MRAKIISLALCFYLVISPSLAKSYQAKNPDPEFLGDFMVYNFLNSQFNLKESDKYQKALSDIPESFRDLTKFWTLIYLSWTFDYLASKEYGKQFSDKMLDTANKKWIKAGKLSGENFEIFKYWFPKLDSTAKNSTGKIFEGQEIPAEVFFAYTFFLEDSGSPFFKQANPDLKNMLDFLIAIALAEAKDASMNYMERVIEMRGPLDSYVENDNRHFYDNGSRQPNPPKVSKKGSTEKSIEDAQDQVRQRPNDPDAHFNLGKAYFLSDQYQEAIKPFKEAITSNPGYSFAYYALGASYFKLGQYQKAINSYKKATQINPTDAHSHEELGIVYSNQGQYKKAITSLKEAIRLEPNKEKAYFFLGEAYHYNNQFQEAIFSLKEGLRLNPNDASAYTQLGRSYNKLKRYEEAIDSFNEAIRIDPNNYNAHNNLGVYYENMSRREEAISEYKKAISIDPKNPLARNNLTKLESKMASAGTTFKDGSLNKKNIKLKMLQNLKEAKKLEAERALLQEKLENYEALNLSKNKKRHQDEYSTKQNKTSRSIVKKDFKDGLDAYDRKDYKTAFHKWKPLAEQGYPNSQINLALLYKNGYGVPKDFQEAAKWYRLAAEQGNSTAQGWLAEFYYDGTGVVQNYHKSFKWRKLAAEQGEPFSQVELGALYYIGRGVDKDLIQAHKWFTMAKNNGNENGKKGIAIVEKDMTPNQLIEAQNPTKHLLNKSHAASNQAKNNKIPEKGNNNDLQKYSKYNTLAGSLYDQFMQIITNSYAIDKLSESFLSENITSEYATNQKFILSAKSELKVDSFNKNLAAFAPPSISLPSFKKTMKDFNAYLNTLPRLARKSLDLSYKMFDAAIDQNFELYNEIDMLSRETYISLLEGENNLLNLRKLNLNSNTPGYNYYNVIQHSNNSIINITKARMGEFFNDNSSSELDYLTGDSQAYIRIAKIELGKGQDIVNSSNLVINNWVSKQRDAFSKFPQHITTFELMGQSLTKSFEVENNVISVLEAIISEYPNVENLDKIDILLGELMNQRLSLQKKRAGLLSKFKN
jgi:tetratricopeptide (TPR) repeat protein